MMAHLAPGTLRCCRCIDRQHMDTSWGGDYKRMVAMQHLNNLMMS